MRRVWRKWCVERDGYLFSRVRDEGARERCAGAVRVDFTSFDMEGCVVRASVQQRPDELEGEGNEGVFVKDGMGRWRDVEPSS